MARVVEDADPYGEVIDGAGCGGTHGSRPTGHFCRAGPACPAGSAVQARAGDRKGRPYGSVQGMRRGGALPLPAGGEIGEAPPMTDAASRFRGSAPIGGHDSGRESVGTTVGKRTPPLRILCNTNFCNKKGMPVRASLLSFYAGAIALARVCAYSISRRLDCLASWVTLGRISSRTPLSYLALMLAVSMPATLKLRL